MAPGAGGPRVVIDTSGMEIALAVAREGSSMAWIRHRPQGHISEQLRPALDRLLEGEQIGLDAIGSLAVVRGPGSFTGLRVGLSFALGLSAARGIPAVGLSSLDSLAAGVALAHGLEGDLLALFRSGSIRNDWYARNYHLSGGRAVALGEAAVLMGDALRDAVDSAGALAGDIPSGAFAARTYAGRGELLAGADHLAKLALESGDELPPLTPLYVLEPAPVARRMAAAAEGNPA